MSIQLFIELSNISHLVTDTRAPASYEAYKRGPTLLQK